jgi:Raf kinase inhibitor-like YbhB/YbcL family protein
MRALMAGLAVFLTSCGTAPEEPAGGGPAAATGALQEMILTSTALAEGTWPVEHTCDGANTSPPLEWSGVPDGAAELMLLLQDPDAPGGTFTHWTVFGITPRDGSVAAGAVPPGGTEGTNSFGENAYGGPCPPEGQTHQYVFSLYALAEPSGLGAGASVEDVDVALGDAPLAGVQLTASYGR